MRRGHSNGSRRSKQILALLRRKKRLVSPSLEASRGSTTVGVLTEADSKAPFPPNSCPTAIQPFSLHCSIFGGLHRQLTVAAVQSSRSCILEVCLPLPLSRQREDTSTFQGNKGWHQLACGYGAARGSQDDGPITRWGSRPSTGSCLVAISNRELLSKRALAGQTRYSTRKDLNISVGIDSPIGRPKLATKTPTAQPA